MNRKMKYVMTAICLGGLVVLLTACNYNYKKTDSGMLYKVHRIGKGQPVKQGDFLKIHYEAMLGDSVLFSSMGRIPLFGQFDTSYVGAHDFIDIMGFMNVGDSAVYVRFVDSLVAKGQLQYSPYFKAGATIKGRMRVLDMYATQEAMDKAFQEELEAEKNREIAQLEGWAKTKKLDGLQKTKSGVLVWMERQGNGPKVDSGLMVNVKYDGYLTNGTKFDSNTDSTLGHVQPFVFTVGQREVIVGWDEGIQLFKKGGKGKLLVPAMLAYGMQAQGEKMPAYSNLVFDIEIVDVQVAPARDTTKGALPGMPISN